LGKGVPLTLLMHLRELPFEKTPNVDDPGTNQGFTKDIQRCGHQGVKRNAAESEFTKEAERERSKVMRWTHRVRGGS